METPEYKWCIFDLMSSILLLAWIKDNPAALFRGYYTNGQLVKWDFFECSHSEFDKNSRWKRCYVVELNSWEEVVFWYEPIGIEGKRFVSIAELLKTNPELVWILWGIREIEESKRLEKWIRDRSWDKIHSLLNS